jgi:hypothetical protein
MSAPAEPPKGNNGRDSGSFLAFWTTLPGILTGVAALITAIVGLATLVHSWQGGGQTAPQQQTPAAATSSSLTSTEASSGSGTSGQDATGTSKKGRFVLGRGDAADLEQDFTGFSANDDVMFGPESNPYLYASGTAFLAPIQRIPSKPTCRRALSQHRDPYEAISNLSAPWICVSTTEGHVAYVEIVRTPGVGSAELDLKYTVWY